MSTKAQLRDMIKREARIKSNSTLDVLVDDIVTDILRDYCNLARYYELLVEGVVIPLVDNQQSYALPADFGNFGVVRYGRGPNAMSYRELVVQPDSVRQTWANGYPRFYRMVGNKISFWPYNAIVVADQLIVDYYVDPASVYVVDGDAFPVPRLESAVKKDAIARIQRFHSSDQEAQMTTADGQRSFNAADAGA